MIQPDDAQLKASLVKHEGTMPRPYLDSVGVWTVGIGHNMNRPLSAAAIDQIYLDDVTEAFNECLHAFPWFADLTDTRQRVMVELVFNLGLGRLLGFPKFLVAMNAGNYETAADELLNSKWASQVKSTRAHDLASWIWGSIDV